MEEKVIVGKDTEYPLNGILSMPDNAEGKVPAVILVHGSGPSDMNEHILKQYPFRDLAEALSAKGIAVLRYDKRTFVYGRKMAKHPENITIYDETIEDALRAKEVLLSDERIDHERIFLIGHSMGAMLAGRIDAEGGDFAGLVMMAGSLRSLDEILLYQMKEQEESSSFLNKFIIRKMLKSIESKLAHMDEMSEEEARKTNVSGGMTLYYLKDMKDHPAASYLEKLEKPLLVMQGDCDAQARPEIDYQGIRDLLEGKDNVTFRLYSSLSHLFTPARYRTLKDVRKDYGRAEHIPACVTDDIAAWIMSVK